MLGSSGVGDWQSQEIGLALNLTSHAQRPIIPVLLPGFTNQDALKGFLGNFTWVDLRNGYSTEQIDRLVWGITGEKQSTYEIDPISAPQIGTSWILVAGSGGITPRPSSIDDISKRLGDELALARFSLVTGGWNGVDDIVARAFSERLQQMGQALSGRLVQVMAEGETPHFPAGRLLNEKTEDEAWRRSIERADAVVLVGGIGGTLTTGQWAVQMGKPVFPIADSRGPVGTHGDAYKFISRHSVNGLAIRYRNFSPRSNLKNSGTRLRGSLKTSLDCCCQHFARFNLDFSVRANGAGHQWRKGPPRKLSVGLVADERLGRVTGWTEAS